MILCTMKRTGEADAKGRPVWRCVHVDAGRQCPTTLRGERVSPPVCPLYGEEITAFADLPCSHRGAVTVATVSLCGSCSREVEVAPCALRGGLATLAGVTVGRAATLACVLCEERTQ